MIIGMRTLESKAFVGERIFTYRVKPTDDENFPFVAEEKIVDKVGNQTTLYADWKPCGYGVSQLDVAMQVIAGNSFPSIAIHPLWEQAETILSRTRESSQRLHDLTMLQAKLAGLQVIGLRQRANEAYEKELKRRRLYKKASEGKLTVEQHNAIARPFIEECEKQVERVEKISQQADRIAKKHMEKISVLASLVNCGTIPPSDTTANGENEDENARWT